MKAIIDGKRYDTEKATLVSEATNGAKGDFHYWQAGLYRTRSPGGGRFFVAGKGGPLTSFAQRVAGGMQNGARIIPMNIDEARQWAEQNLTVDEIEEGFIGVAGAIEDA
jgi:hypothetical protein